MGGLAAPAVPEAEVLAAPAGQAVVVLADLAVLLEFDPAHLPDRNE